MNRGLTTRMLAFVVTALAFVALPSFASADAVYHTEHLDLEAIGGAPLRSGFVQNIKAEGPEIYAHEVFAVNGAQPTTTYTVSRNFFYLDPECDGVLVFPSDVAVLETNAGGNATADLFVTPSEVAGFEGVHGVTWAVKNPTGAVAYRTQCTAVTLD